MIQGLKVCGIKDIATLKYLINHSYRPKFIGFITNYKKSKRFVDLKSLRILTSLNRGDIKFVSVLVNPDDKILENIKNLKFEYYQLYDTSPSRTLYIKKKYKVKIISALTIEKIDDVMKYKNYKKVSDIILFDGKGYEKSIAFDHNLLKKVEKSITKMVAGNIKKSDIPNIKLKCYIDVSGSLEIKKGIKSKKKINLFLNYLNKYENKKRHTINRST